VVSSKKTDYIDLGLDRLGLGSWVDVLVGADDTERPKPDPEPLLYAAGLLDAKPPRCVYVGDAVTDVVAGRTAGMATIAVTWGAATVHDLAEAGPRLSSAASPNWQNSCSSTHVERVLDFTHGGE
jgi:pyrophosphatase PpaX